MKKYTIAVILVFISITFLQIDCNDGPPDIPPSSTDSIFLFEKEMIDGGQPSVSPNGRKIAFIRGDNVWTMDTNGTNVKQLTFDAYVELVPRWRPDGLAIGFIRKVPGEMNKGILCSISPEGGDATILVDGHYVGDSLAFSNSSMNYPIWDYSPDGSLVAFLGHNGQETNLKVFSLLTEQIEFDTITFNRLGESNLSGFIWSKNLNEIIYINQINGRQDIVRHNYYSKISIRDSNYIKPGFLSHHPEQPIIAYKQLGWIKILLKDYNFVTLKEYTSYGGGGLKWSPDGNYLLFENQGIVSGPFEYRFSQLAIIKLSTGKQYFITSKGDINQFNYRFDWGKGTNTVYFERFNRINKVYFLIN